MQIDDAHDCRHSHRFSLTNEKAERRTRYVLLLTAVTMVIEIIAGTLSGSMALLADGWHMGTHVAAFGITLFAYRYARIHASNSDYSFGTGKVSVLGGFASAVALSVVALIMALESLYRLFDPHAIHFNEAIIVATVGLSVNFVSAWLLKDGHTHQPNHQHGSDGHHHDHNLRAAYMHVLADALTSMLAIAALLAAKYFGWQWLDPAAGIVGAVIIARWSYTLVRQTGPILLDASIDKNYRDAITDAIESDSDSRVADLHVWKVGVSHYAAIVSVVTRQQLDVQHYRDLLRRFDRLAHLTVEVNVDNGVESV